MASTRKCFPRWPPPENFFQNFEKCIVSKKKSRCRKSKFSKTTKDEVLQKVPQAHRRENTSQCDLSSLKICMCLGTLFEVDESLRGSVDAANKEINKGNRIVNSAHKRGCY